MVAATLTRLFIAAKAYVAHIYTSYQELKIRSWATTQRFSKAKHLLRQEIQERRLDVLASSSPFVHKIEQALTISSSVHTGDGYESLATQTRLATRE